jgi:hypothetical protein
MAEFICWITPPSKEDNLSTIGSVGNEGLFVYLLMVAIKSGWLGVDKMSCIPWNPFFNPSIYNILSLAVLNLFKISDSKSLNLFDIWITVYCKATKI